MANVNDIPRGYAMTGKLNLRADPREYRRWNLFSAVLGLGLIAAGWVWHSSTSSAGASGVRAATRLPTSRSGAARC